MRCTWQSKQQIVLLFLKLRPFLLICLCKFKWICLWVAPQLLLFNYGPTIRKHAWNLGFWRWGTFLKKERSYLLARMAGSSRLILDSVKKRKKSSSTERKEAVLPNQRRKLLNRNAKDQGTNLRKALIIHIRWAMLRKAMPTSCHLKSHLKIITLRSCRLH